MLSYPLSGKMKKSALIILFMLTLSFCSFFRLKVPPYPTGVVFPLEKADEIVYKGEIIDLVQRVEDNIYLSTRKGFVYCIDGRRHEILWKFEAPEPLASPPHIAQDSVYVFDIKNILYSLDKEGKLRWKKRFEEEITSGIEENNRQIYFGTANGSFFALNQDNGEKLWSFQTGEAIRSKPVVARGIIMFGCDDHNLYFLTGKGALIDRFNFKDKIQAPLTIDGDFLYLGSEDRYFYCIDIKKRKQRWKVKTGSQTYIPPVVDENRVFFLCWNGVLYCLNKKNGTILWWNTVPSRSFYHLEIIEKKIVVSSFSSLLVCFEIETGEKKGNFDASQEIRSNPLWFDPHLLINLYDSHDDTGRLLFLKKEVKVVITSSKDSPQEISEEIVFNASATGFYLPRYEFYIKKGKEKEIVKEKSEQNSWAWFPEKEGTYIVGVVVVDEKEKAEAEISFVVEKGKKDKEKIINNIIKIINNIIMERRN